MKKKKLLTLLTSLLAASACVTNSAIASDSSLCSQSAIVVKGEGEVKAVADQTIMLFEVVSVNKDAKAARDSVESTVTKFVDALSKEKITDIQADSITLNPIYKYEKNEQKLTSYNARREVKVILSDLDKIPQVTDLAVQSGINKISGFSYKVKDENALKQKSQQLAIENAKKEAKLLSEAFELELGKPCYIEFDRNYASPYPVARTFALQADAPTGENATYKQYEYSVKSVVTVKYSIK